MFIAVPIMLMLLGSVIFISAHLYKKTRKSSKTSLKKRTRPLKKSDFNLQKILPNLLPDQEIGYFDHYNADYFQIMGIVTFLWGVVMLIFYL